MSNTYRKRILDHYRNPRNYGEIDDPDIVFEDANPSCGDEIKVFAALDGKKINDIKFKGDGCAISQASASILTEKVKDKDITEIREIETEDIKDMIGVELSPMRIKCAVLGLKVLEGGIVKFQEKEE